MLHLPVTTTKVRCRRGRGLFHLPHHHLNFSHGIIKKFLSRTQLAMASFSFNYILHAYLYHLFSSDRYTVGLVNHKSNLLPPPPSPPLNHYHQVKPELLLITRQWALDMCVPNWLHMNDEEPQILPVSSLPVPSGYCVWAPTPLTCNYSAETSNTIIE